MDIQIRKMVIQSQSPALLAKKRWTPIAIYFILIM